MENRRTSQRGHLGNLADVETLVRLEKQQYALSMLIAKGC
jgi:hypothetical protein